MAGYQTLEALRPILHRGPPATPVLDRMLFYKPRMRTSPSLEKIKRAVELRKAGRSINSIAAEIGVRSSTIRRYVKNVAAPAEGWSNGSRKSRFTDAQIAKAERMRRAGFTWIEIGEDLGCNKSTIRRALGKDKRHRTRETPLSRVVRAARVVTGIPGPTIRQTDDRGPKVSAEVARARHIVFWIAHRHLGISQVEIAEKLGGFNVKTVSLGCLAADPVASRLPIRDGMKAEAIFRRFWQAEWPKAST